MKRFIDLKLGDEVYLIDKKFLTSYTKTVNRLEYIQTGIRVILKASIDPDKNFNKCLHDVGIDCFITENQRMIVTPSRGEYLKALEAFKDSMAKQLERLGSNE